MEPLSPMNRRKSARYSFCFAAIMRDLTPLEKMFIVMSTVIILGGLWAVVFPRAFAAMMPGNEHHGSGKPYLQSFSESDCKRYGALCIGAGLGLNALACFPLNRRRDGGRRRSEGGTDAHYGGSGPRPPL